MNDTSHYIFIRNSQVIGYSNQITRSEAERLAQGFYNDAPEAGPVTVAVFAFMVQQAELPFFKVETDECVI